MAQDFMKIKAFAERAGMKTSTLRRYDEKGIFRPEKLGDQLKNKYRYYTRRQLTMVKMCKIMAAIDVPQSAIIELSQDRSPQKVLKRLQEQDDLAAEQIRFYQRRRAIIAVYRELINAGISATETKISVSEMPEYPITFGDTNDFSGLDDFYEPYEYFCNNPPNFGSNGFFPVGGYFSTMTAFQKSPSQPTRFFTLDPNGQSTKPAGTYLVGYTRGYYGETNDLPGRMADFAEMNGLEYIGSVYNIYLFDEISMPDPNEYLLQVSVPVKETRSHIRLTSHHFERI